MAAQSMDDSNIRALERQCEEANAAFHKQADSAIKHAGIFNRQVASGGIGSAKFRVLPVEPKKPTGSGPMKKPEIKL